MDQIVPKYNHLTRIEDYVFTGLIMKILKYGRIEYHGDSKSQACMFIS